MPKHAGILLYSALYGLYELNDGIAVVLREVVELFSRRVSIGASGIAVPHNGLDDGAGTAVVQAVVGTC